MHNCIYITAYGIKMLEVQKMQLKIEGTASLIYMQCNTWIKWSYFP